MSLTLFGGCLDNAKVGISINLSAGLNVSVPDAIHVNQANAAKYEHAPEPKASEFCAFVLEAFCL